MKFETRSFRTKVGKRIFLLFIICAILPVSAFALFSYIQVKDQLTEQSLNRLRQDSKSIAVSLYERLIFIRSELNSMALNYREMDIHDYTPPAKMQQHFKERFNAMEILSGGKKVSLLGEFKNLPILTPRHLKHLSTGNALLVNVSKKEEKPVLVMFIQLDPKYPKRGILAAEINSTFLWEASDRMPPMMEICVIDGSNRILHSSFDNLTEFPLDQFKKIRRNHFGRFEWQKETDTYFSFYTTLFLEPNFLYPEWIILLSEPTPHILAPMASFKLIFPALIVLTLGMIFFLGMGLIRKNLVPIEILKEATQKISSGSFGHRVDIDSGDEFEELGTSFNEMSRKLKDGELLLVRSAKMGAIGQMAAGIVHEIKQPLSTIYGYMQLSLMEAKPGEGRENLKTIMTAVNRLDTIVARFSSFTQMKDEQLKGIILTDVIQDVHKLMAHQFLKKEIKCVIESGTNIPPIIGDSTGLQQVYSNLIFNGMDALEDKQQGQRLLRLNTYASEERVISEIEDNGSGMPKDILEKIFDPFFTTKDSEKGTGLGMAIVESILHKHEATINVESTVGLGTKITISFPAFNKERML